MSDNPNTGSFRPWHPRGMQVTLPCPADPVAALAYVAAALDAGWLVQAPGLEAGEEKESVGYVLRSSFEADGRSTPFVLLYAVSDALKWSFLKCYLNSPADIAAFETASVLRLEKLPEYVGADKPQRGASPKTDRFIVPAPRPFEVVFRANPKHDDSETGKMKPARLFVRWGASTPAAPAPAATPEPVKATAAPPAAKGPALPANGHELHQRMVAKEGEMVAAGLCGHGELIKFVANGATREGISDGIEHWDAHGIGIAVGLVKKFVASRTKKEAAPA